MAGLADQDQRNPNHGDRTFIRVPAKLSVRPPPRAPMGASPVARQEPDLGGSGRSAGRLARLPITNHPMGVIVNVVKFVKEMITSVDEGRRGLCHQRHICWGRRATVGR